jgi:dynein heavy chain 2
VNTLSKLTWADMRKFALLLADIFPGANSTDIVYEEVGKAVRLALDELKLSSNDAQIAKILQFYEATQQRMGVVLVGPSGCGKTTIWKVLKRAL